MTPNEPMHLISLGAGVQSSTMALMAAQGEITPMPAAAIFADTGDEPESVYRWLDWLKPKLEFPVVTVSVGRLSLASLAVRTSKAGNKYMRPGLPVFFDKDDLGEDGRGKRHCSNDYKIKPILRYANGIRGDQRVVMWVGISLDEWARGKPSREPWCDNRWPLLDMRMRREGCLEWMQAHGYPEPPRSACVFCPFHSNAEWRRLKQSSPEEFAAAVEYERKYQAAAVGVFDRTPYLHRSCVPLPEADIEDDDGQLSLWQDECEGICGI